MINVLLEVMQKILNTNTQTLTEPLVSEFFEYCFLGFKSNTPATNLKSLENLVLLLKNVNSLQYHEQLMHCFVKPFEETSSVPHLNNLLTLLAEMALINATDKTITQLVVKMGSLENHQDPAVRCNIILVFQKFIDGWIKNNQENEIPNIAPFLKFIELSATDDSHSVTRQTISFCSSLLMWVQDKNVAQQISPEFIINCFTKLHNLFTTSYWLTVRSLIALACSSNFLNLQNVISSHTTKRMQVVL